MNKLAKIDTKRNRIIFSVLTILLVSIITIMFSSSNTFEGYNYIETDVEKTYKKFIAETANNDIFEKYFVADTYIKRISAGTTVVDFKKNINDETVEFYKEDVIVSGGEISTGMKLVRNDKEYDVYVSGDLNGNGKIESQDISILIEISKKTELTESEKITSDINEDGLVDKTDIELLTKAYLGDAYEIKEVARGSVPSVEIASGTTGENNWYLNEVTVVLTTTENKKSKYRIRNVEGEEEKEFTGLEYIKSKGFNAYKIETYNYSEEGNITGINSVTFKVDDREIEASVRFDTTEATNKPVTATIEFNKENVFVSNNEHKLEKKFTKNGTFTFEYFDITGRTGTKEVEVSWVSIEEMIGQDGLWKYTYHDDDYIYLTEYLGGCNENKDLVIPAEYDGYNVYGIGNQKEGYTICNYHFEDDNAEHIFKSLTIEEGIQEIGDYALPGLMDIEGDLVIPDSVKYIGYGGLGGAQFSGKLVLSNNLEYIGPMAFVNGNFGEGGLIIPDKVKTIEMGAFSYFEAGENILEIGDNVETIGEMAFANISYTGDLVIPDSVKIIKDGAFSEIDSSGTLTLGNSIEEIGMGAFYGSHFTGDLTIPNSVKTIGDMAFTEVGFTGSLVLGNSLETVGMGAFGANGFTGDLIMPDSLKNMGMVAFGANPFDGTLRISENLESIPQNAFYELKFTGDLIIPNSVKAIGEYAFYNTGFVGGKVTIGDSVESIGDYAFYYTNFEGDLVIPDSVKTIGQEAFSYALKLKTLKLGKNLIEIGESAFENTNFEGDLVIPDSVTTIGEAAFDGAFSIGGGSLTLGKSITSIGMYAFDCANFEGDLVIPGSLSTVTKYSFREASFTGGLTLLDGVTKVNAYAFDLVNFGGSVNLGNTLSTIENNGFSITAKGDLVIPNSVTTIGGRVGIQTNGKLTIGNGITEIPDNAFYVGVTDGFTGELVIPDNVTKIGKNAFQNTNFTSLKLGKGLQTINSQAFAFMSKLSGDIIIPENVTNIADDAFYYTNVNLVYENGN